jgi:hypothetical protein
MKWLFAVVCFLIFCPTVLLSQGKATERADRLFEEMSYPAATDAYAKIVKEQPKNRHAALRLAECYRLLNDTRNAQRWYARAVKFKGIKPETWFQYGQVLMVNRKYKEALPWFEKYRDAIPDDPRAHDMIEACLNLDRFTASAGLYAIKRLRVNSEASDFGPAFYKDKVVFASARKRQLFDSKYNRTGQGFLDLYAAPYAGKPALGEPELFRGKVNTPYHEATPCFSKDGKEMFFTRNNYFKGKMNAGTEGVVNLATFVSIWAEGKWQLETPLPFNSQEYSVGHPCLSIDGNRLYFVSNMPGGEGATDLYYVDREGDQWGDPVNLGPKVNTRGVEMFPTMLSDGTLCFSSDGRAGMGGMDIFTLESDSYRIDAENNLQVVNVGAPINSAGDDFSMIFDDAKGVGFFTSNRRGGKGDDDIYAYTKLIPLIGLVKDPTGKPLEGVTVSVLTGRSVLRLGTDETGKFVYGLSDGQSLRFVFDLPGYAKTDREIKAKELKRGENNLMEVEMNLLPAQGQ